jgi:hypothetical protein
MKQLILPESYKYMAVFPTFRCSLNCSYCINAVDETFSRDSSEISGAEWIDALNRLESPSIPVSFSGGEPGVHPEFIKIIKGVKPELKRNILTNLYWKPGLLEEFIGEIKPELVGGNPKYPSIRVSYHPEQMGNGKKLLERVLKLKDAGFSIGVEAINYPSDEQSMAIEQMGIQCRNADVSFRIKSFAGIYNGKDDLGKPFSMRRGNYSRYPDSVFQETTKSSICRTTELIVGPNADVFRCHRDLYSQENAVGSLLNPEFEISDVFRKCDKYGQCNPCDVKSKSDSSQQLGHTSVEIKKIGK